MLKKALLLSLICLSLQASSVSQEIIESDEPTIGLSVYELGLKPSQRIKLFSPVFKKAMTESSLERLLNEDIRSGDGTVGEAFDQFYQSNIPEAYIAQDKDPDSESKELSYTQPEKTFEIVYTTGPLKGSILKFNAVNLPIQDNDIIPIRAPVVGFYVTIFSPTRSYAAPVTKIIARIRNDRASTPSYMYIVQDTHIATSYRSSPTINTEALMELQEKVNSAITTQN